MKEIILAVLLLFLPASIGYSRQSVSPLAFTIKPDMLLYKEDEKISLTLVVRNVSTEKVSVNTWGFKYDDPYEILNSGRVNIYHRISYKQRPIPQKKDYVVLELNETKKFTLYIYQEEKLMPGSYSITYYYESDGQYFLLDGQLTKEKAQYAYVGKLASNTVRIKIVRKQNGS